MPNISVIIPAYNAERTIKQTLQSVLNQTYCDFEVIVIDDCSTDNTYALAEELGKSFSQFRLHRNEENRGVSFSRNFGVRIAKGEWIAFLDSDDLWHPTKLEKQVALTEQKSDAVITYTGSAFINEDSEPYDFILPAEEETTYQTLLRRNLLSCSSVMVKKAVMETISMPSDRMSEDYYAWLTILKTTPYAYGVNEPLLIYRISRHSKSGNRIKAAKMTYRTYRAIGYALPIALLFTVRYAKYSISKRHHIKVSHQEEQKIDKA